MNIFKFFFVVTLLFFFQLRYPLMVLLDKRSQRRSKLILNLVKFGVSLKILKILNGIVKLLSAQPQKIL